MDLGLAGRSAIVTGGSKGLGKAITAELMAEGAAVVICSRHADELTAAAEELAEQAAGPGAGTVVAMPCDVTDAGQVDRLREQLRPPRWAGSTSWSTTLAVRGPASSRTLTDDDWHADIEVKLFSQIRCTRSALPHLRRSSAARVININAVYARYPDPAFLASSVNRASCLSLSKALSMELGREGILVNSVNIGLVETPQWENIHQPPRTGDARSGSSSGSWPRTRCRSAGSAGPTRSPGWSRSWPAIGRVTSPARPST